MREDLYSYWTNKAFLKQVSEKIRTQLAASGAPETHTYEYGTIISALSQLEDKYLFIILERLIEKKTLREIGRERGVCHQYVHQLEHIAYAKLIDILKNKPKQTSWADKPLSTSHCKSSGKITFTFRSLPPELLDKLIENGYDTNASLCSATPAQLMKINGIGPKRVEKIQQAVVQYQRQYPNDFEGGPTAKKSAFDDWGIVTKIWF